MNETDFHEIVQKITGADPRYDREAYSFMREAVDFTVRSLGKPASGVARHISGSELLEGIRRYSLHEFGPMSLTVLEKWGIHNTSDFGEIVFNLVDHGVLGKTEQDSREDFAVGYDFDDAFARPYIPEKPVEHGKSTRKKAGNMRSSRKDKSS